MSAKELGKKLPLSKPVIIKRPINPAVIDKALETVRGTFKNTISIIVLHTAVR